MRVFPGYILCTCAYDSTGDLVYASVVKEYCNLAILSKFQHGGEYTSRGFVDFCGKAGIKREFTFPYNPQ